MKKKIDKSLERFDKVLKDCKYSSISDKDKPLIQRLVIDCGKEVFIEDLKSRLTEYKRATHRNWIDVSDIEYYLEKI